MAPDTFGLAEIDEDAYPLLMAFDAGFAGRADFYMRHIRPDADFIVDHGPRRSAPSAGRNTPASPRPRSPRKSPGAVAAAHLAQAAGDPARAHLYLATADAYQRNVGALDGHLLRPLRPKYFLRLSPTGHPNIHATYDLGNGSLSNVDQRDVVDAGLLELTRLGELPPRDDDVLRSLPVTDSVIESRTSSGPGWHRYGVSPALFGLHRAAPTGTATATCPTRLTAPQPERPGSAPPPAPATRGRFSMVNEPNRTCKAAAPQPPRPSP